LLTKSHWLLSSFSVITFGLAQSDHINRLILYFEFPSTILRRHLCVTGCQRFKLCDVISRYQRKAKLQCHIWHIFCHVLMTWRHVFSSLKNVKILQIYHMQIRFIVCRITLIICIEESELKTSFEMQTMKITEGWESTEENITVPSNMIYICIQWLAS